MDLLVSSSFSYQYVIPKFRYSIFSTGEMSAYENIVGGKLKLKGKALDVKAGGLKKKKKHKKHFDQISQVSENELSAGWLIVNCVTCMHTYTYTYTHIPIMASLEMKMILLIIQNIQFLLTCFFPCFRLILFKFGKSSSWLTSCVVLNRFLQFKVW